MNAGTKVYLLLDRSILRATVEGPSKRLERLKCRPDGWRFSCEFLRVGEIFPRTEEGLKRIREAIDFDHLIRVRRLEQMRQEDSELRELAG